MRELVIAPPERKDGKESKGRAFRAVHLAHVEADSLWEGGMADTEAIRPVWLMVGGTEAEIRPFVTNLQLGRKAELIGRFRNDTKRIELLRSAGYVFSWQRVRETRRAVFAPSQREQTNVQAIVTAYLPDLFRMDLGMVDPKGVKFCLLPTNDWVGQSTVDPKPAVDHVRRAYGKVGVPISDEELQQLVPIAILFCAFLDRRTRCPLISDTCFYLQLFCAALAQGIAGWTREAHGHWGRHDRLYLREWGIADVRLTLGIACNVTHDVLELFLSEQVKVYFEVKVGLS